MSASTLTHRVHRTQGLIPDHDTHTQRKAHSLAQTHLYCTNTITWLLMSCLHTKYWDGKLIHTVCGFLVWVTNVCVNERGSVFSSVTALWWSQCWWWTVWLTSLSSWTIQPTTRNSESDSGGTNVNPTKTPFSNVWCRTLIVNHAQLNAEKHAIQRNKVWEGKELVCVLKKVLLFVDAPSQTP